MKKLLFIIMPIMSSLTSFGQGVGINLDGALPIAGTMLDIKGASDDNTTYGLQVKDSSGNALMVVRSDGNVGIGTTGPSTLLEIAGTNGDQFTLDNDGSQWTQMNLFNNGVARSFLAYDNTNHIFAIGAFSGNTSLDYIGFRPTGGADRMVIEKDGNVGIGTTTPVTNFDINGDMILSGSDRYLNFDATSGTSGYGFRNNGGTMEYKNSGGVWREFCTTESGVSPSFAVHKNGTGQAISSSTFTKVTWSTEEFDSNNNFASDRFTPTAAGKYLLTATIAIPTWTISTSMVLYIYKNGVVYKSFSHTAQSAFNLEQSSSISAVVDANGTTDYFEIYVWTNAALTLGGGNTHTHFSGGRIDAGNSSATFVDVYRSSGVSLPCNTWAKVTFNTEVDDTDDLHNTTNGRLTLPPGVWQINFASTGYSNTVEDNIAYFAGIYKNGSVFKQGARSRNYNDYNAGAGISTLVKANGTDYFEFYLYRGNCAVTATSNSGSDQLWMNAAKVGE